VEARRRILEQVCIRGCRKLALELYRCATNMMFLLMHVVLSSCSHSSLALALSIGHCSVNCRASSTTCSYDGDYRGVGFVPHLCDGDPRQYAYLPLDLF
jgi:hypothetical protein